jgi:hypothetical protein
MTIFVCLCGNTKTDQPYNSANRNKWICPQCVNQEYSGPRGEMVDAGDLKFPANRRGGSTPSVGTIIKRRAI